MTFLLCYQQLQKNKLKHKIMDGYKIALYLIILSISVYGFLMGKNITPREFVSNSNNTKFFPVFMSILATVIGGWMIFGLAEIGFNAGIIGYVLGFGYFLGLFVLSFLIPKIKNYMDANKCVVIDDVIAVRYGEKTRHLVSFFQLIVLMAIIGAQFFSIEIIN